MIRRVKAAAFLDRDGTIIDDIGFVARVQDVRVLPTVADALRLLADAGYARIVVSNQSGVARGYFDADVVRAVNAAVAQRLAGDGAALDAFYFCPHYGVGCACRKPEPGMVEQAAREHVLDVARSFVVGDRGSDIGLGKRLGIPAILVPGPLAYAGPEPDYRASTLLDAAQWVLRRGA